METNEVQIMVPVRARVKISGISSELMLKNIEYQIQDLLTQACATEKASEYQSVDLGVEYARKTLIDVKVEKWEGNPKS